MVSKDILAQALGATLESTVFENLLGRSYIGKVRDNYTQGDTRLIIVTDRISAFDRVLGTLPFKGQILNQMAAYWFEKTQHIAPNHMISTPDPQVMKVWECKPLPVEMVMRAYVTGVTSTSIWTHYKQGKRVFCGHQLPDGLQKNQRLPSPILTPSTKAEQGDHDVSASREEILAMGHISEKDFDTAADMARSLFTYGQKLCETQGLILVDTKYEFGKKKDGTIVVIDEIHTPDSSRFWFLDSYMDRFMSGKDPESFDKEYVRRWLAGQGFQGDGPIPTIPDEVRIEATLRYIEAYERITGNSFEPNRDPPALRIAKNLG